MSQQDAMDRLELGDPDRLLFCRPISSEFHRVDVREESLGGASWRRELAQARALSIFADARLSRALCPQVWTALRDVPPGAAARGVPEAPLARVVRC